MNDAIHLLKRAEQGTVLQRADAGHDGKFVYAVIGTRAAYRGVSVSFEETLTAVRIVRVPVKGGRLEAVVSLPFEEVGGIGMFPDGRRFVCAVYVSRSDVWAVDDFDPSVSPASH